MPSLTFPNSAATRGEKMFWALVAALAAGQLIALWMLCSHQVRQAQLREASAQVERSAVADCLRDIPRSAAGHCAARLAAARHDPEAALAAVENTANLSASALRTTHVNFSLR